MSESFESERAPEPVGAFPHGKRVGELLFVSCGHCNQLDPLLKEMM